MSGMGSEGERRRTRTSPVSAEERGVCLVAGVGMNGEGRRRGDRWKCPKHQPAEQPENDKRGKSADRGS